MRRRLLNTAPKDNVASNRSPSPLDSANKILITRYWSAATGVVVLLTAALCISLTVVANHNVALVHFLRPKSPRSRPVPLDPEIIRLRRQFPLRASEMEEIPHPGILFSGSQRAKILLPDMEFPERLTVPRFWNPPEYGPRGVRHFLGEHGQRLMTPKEAQSIGSVTNDGKETIFVSLASYRDIECQATLESIFLRAAYPERIRVAVVDQVEPGDPKCSEPALPCDQHPEQVLCLYQQMIDAYEVPSYLMVGPVLARHIAHRMYRGKGNVTHLSWQSMRAAFTKYHLTHSPLHHATRRILCSSNRCPRPIHTKLG